MARIRARLIPVFLALALSVASGPIARAYDTSLHYFLTYALSRRCALADAGPIAWADYETDVSELTKPELPQNLRAREVFHFRVTPGHGHPDSLGGQTETVVHAGSRESRALVVLALQGAASDPDPILFGTGLHAFQDSWSHAGFEPRWGHATDLFNIAHGFDPLLVDNPQFDPGAAQAMAYWTWDALNQWAHLTKPDHSTCPGAWTDVSPLVSELIAAESNYPGKTKKLRAALIEKTFDERWRGYETDVDVARATAQFTRLAHELLR